MPERSRLAITAALWQALDGAMRLGLERSIRQRAWAGVSVFQVARLAGTSIRMIERHYGALLDGSGAEIASRLDALDASQEREDEARSEDG